MSLFVKEIFSKKLHEMDSSQGSVRSISKWIQSHDKPVETAIMWMDEILNAPTDRIPTYFYLCNDVLQCSRNSKGNDCNKYIETFGEILPEVVQNTYSKSSKTERKLIERLLNI